MLDLLTWLGLAVAILASAYLLTRLFWRPERNVDRSMLGHWFRSLIRLYESDSLVRVSHRGSRLGFSLRRRAGDGAQCWVVLSLPAERSRAGWMTPRLGPVREAIAAEPRALILPDLSGRDPDRLDVQISIPDIWSREAADVALRIADRVLDALGVEKGARFDLEFTGEESIERALEARRRQRSGELEEW